MSKKNKFKYIVILTLIISTLLIETRAFAISSVNVNDKYDNRIEPLRFGIVERKKFVETKTITKTIVPGGQETAISFKTKGGVYVSSGGPTITVSGSFNCGYLSFGVSAGYVRKNKVSGVFVSYPPDGKPYIVKDDVKIKCNVYKVELYDQEFGKVTRTYYKVEPKIIEHSYYVTRR